MTLKGLDDMVKQLNRLSDRLGELDGVHEIPADQLMTNSFMSRTTRFSSFEEMVAESPFEVESAEDFEKIPDDEWDDYVADTTSFLNWQEMLAAAGKEWVGKKIDL